MGITSITTQESGKLIHTSPAAGGSNQSGLSRIAVAFVLGDILPHQAEYSYDVGEFAAR